jgi:dihydrofolate reductase
MRKIVAGEFVSLDGVMEAPDQWHFPYFDDAMGSVVDEQMQGSDTMLLGRVTYEEFASYWPGKTEEDTPGASFMNGLPKLVVSTTLNDVSAWENSTLIDKNDILGNLARLKEQPGKDISIVGSARLVQSLLEAGLLDELRLLVHPIIVGHGKRIYAEQDKPTGLKLIDSRIFDTGVLYLTYAKDA